MIRNAFKPYLFRPFNTSLATSRPTLSYRPLYFFSKKPKVQLRVPTIKIQKLNKQFDGFLLYDNPSATKFKAISILYLLCFISGYWTYSHLDDYQIRINYMILGAVMASAYVIFILRTNRTLKRMILESNGQNVILTRFKLGGFGQEHTKARVDVLRGFHKAFVFGGSVIKGGGMYGLEERNYWFQGRYIKDKEIFDQVAQGNTIKVDRIKIYK